MIPFIDLKKQYRRIESQVDKAIKNRESQSYALQIQSKLVIRQEIESTKLIRLLSEFP